MKFLVLTLLFFTGCSTVKPPTKIYQSQQLNISGLVEGARSPLVIDDSTFVIDARSQFDYSLSHIPQSISLQWDEFSRPGAIHRGLLNEDLFKVTRRLARKGLGPETKVIVLGNGLQGAGEEARLTWTLLYIGIKNVQFAGLSYFQKAPMTNEQSPPKKNAKMWKPNLVSSLISTKEEIRKAMAPASLKGKVYLIDVRSQREYFQKTDGGSFDINAINIPWEKFISEVGRPNFKIKKELSSFGVSATDRIITISNQGIRSGAVAAALTLMGYSNVGNYNGGYQMLFKK
ncbi:MAG: hypothetical protein KDD58_11405 [Bdellovibrionales bacterium]|nr:hypothetical protein [Bdellovibrionales bacterium]